MLSVITINMMHYQSLYPHTAKELNFTQGDINPWPILTSTWHLHNMPINIITKITLNVLTTKLYIFMYLIVPHRFFIPGNKL